MDRGTGIFETSSTTLAESKEIDNDEAMLESFTTGKGNMSLLACVSADDGVNRLIISHLFVGH